VPCAGAASAAPVASRRPSQVPVGAARGDNAERGGVAAGASLQRKSHILDVPGDRYEQEADAVARAAVAATAPDRAPGRTRASAAVPESVLAKVEPLLGTGLGHVRVRADVSAEAVAHRLNASAFTHGDEIWLGSGSRSTDVGLMAHELTHTVQQGGPQGAQVPSIQRQVATQPTTAPAAQPSGQTTPQPPQATGQPATTDPLTAPLTDADWGAIDLFLSRGAVALGPLTDDPEHNADLVAAEIFCDRWSGSPDWGNGDPLLCLVLDVTMGDPRVQAIRGMVTAQGPLIKVASVQNSGIIQQLAATFGWGRLGQFGALTQLIQGESGGNPQATNPDTGALGIAQALGHGTSCSAGTLGNMYGPDNGLSCAQAVAANPVNSRGFWLGWRA
jgi:Domain of unknown function (DUF4157)